MPHQPFQKRGLNKPNRLHSAYNKFPTEICYAYPQHLIHLGEDGTFVQTRSGPNWLGGILTMTTCKHRLRSFKTPEEWEQGYWLAGFTPKIDGENYLLYLARVHKAASSMVEMYGFLKYHHPEALERKLAHKNPVGDIYKPRNIKKSLDWFDPDNYVYPKGHVREQETYKDGTPKWHRDIDYTGAGGKRHALFLYNNVCLFNKPMVKCTRNLYRSGFKTTVGELVRENLSTIYLGD